MDFEEIRRREEDEEEIDLMEYWRMVVRRRWVIAVVTGAVLFLVAIVTFTATPMYKATTVLMIEEENSRIMNYEDEFGYRYTYMDERFFNTQLRLLQSKSLAERVARKMDLLAREEFGAGEERDRSLLSEAKKIVTLRWLRGGNGNNGNNGEADNPGIPENPYSGVANAVRGGLEVSPVRETKLVEVSYSSPYPVLSAQIVNTIGEEFINFSVEKRYAATQQASDFLSEQIANLREELAAKERELQRYGQEKELFFLSDKESTAVSKFEEVNNAYTQAQIERIKAESAYRELSSLDINSLPQYINNPLIQSLRTDYVRLKNEFDDKSKTYKPDYPQMVNLKARLNSLRDELRSEIQKAVDAAETEYKAALERERSLLELLDEQKQDVVQMNSNAILYNSLRIEVENKQELLNSLVERQSQTEVSARLEGLKTSNISIIDQAEVPKAPVSPKKKRNLLLGLLVGLFGGVGLAFMLEYLDNSIKGPEEVEKLTGIPSLGVVPYLPPEGASDKKKRGYRSYYRYYSYGEKKKESEESMPEITEIELINHRYPKFSISEDYRSVRTSILLSYADNPPKTIVLSSALPKEGKTVTAANMAVAFAQLKERVMLVDADMRKPRLHRIFNVKNVGGLSGYLTSKVPFEKAVQQTSIENIWLVPSGPVPPNPAELLNSKRMQVMLDELKKGFDVILIDTPPLQAVIDPVIAASMADATVMIVKAGETPEKPFLQSVEDLQRGQSRIMGVVFNELKLERGGAYYYSGYKYKYGRYGKYGE